MTLGTRVNTESNRLLVVDDEPAIGRACRRILAPAGIAVDDSTDPCEGLRWAVGRGYSGVLLDLDMPDMDGYQLLESLHRVKPELPVVALTDFRDPAGAARAVRLGASDCLAKPFEGGQLRQVVQGMLERGAIGDGTARGPREPSPGGASETGSLRFLGKSWIAASGHGLLRVGAIVPDLLTAETIGFAPPHVGEVAYQGLPLASVSANGGAPLGMPSPVSGVVLSVNDELEEDPRPLAHDPTGAGWIAEIIPVRWSADAIRCRPRRVVLVNSDADGAARQRTALEGIGCRVRLVRDPRDPPSALPGLDEEVVFIDADSTGERGPDVLDYLTTFGFFAEVVVLSASPNWMARYGSRRVRYHPSKPLVDADLLTILDEAFPGPGLREAAEGRRVRRSDVIRAIRAVDASGRRIALVVEPASVGRTAGLERAVLRQLKRRGISIEVLRDPPGSRTPTIAEEAATCDRLLILSVRDSGRLPGSLSCRAVPGTVGSAGERASDVVLLEVQPSPAGHGIEDLEASTTEALSLHVAREVYPS